MSYLLLAALLATASAPAQDPALAPPESAMTQPSAPPVVPGTEALELGEPDAPVHCLLVHGFAGSRKDFADLGELLAEAGCHVRLERLPGHGTTPEDMEAATADELVDHVRQAVRQAKAEHERVILVGFSMGGAISTIVAAEEPVDRLVLLAPCFEIQHQWYYFERPEWWAEKLGSVVRWVPKTESTVQVNRKEARHMLFSYPRISTRSVLTLAELGQRASDPALLGAIDVPVLVVHSPGDFAASQAASEALFPLLGSSDTRYVRMDDRNNHHLLWDFDREVVKNEIMAFVKPDLPLPAATDG
jgi:carboxylesterase